MLKKASYIGTTSSRNRNTWLRLETLKAPELQEDLDGMDTVIYNSVCRTLSLHNTDEPPNIKLFSGPLGNHAFTLRIAKLFGSFFFLWYSYLYLCLLYPLPMYNQSFCCLGHPVCMRSSPVFFCCELIDCKASHLYI